MINKKSFKKELMQIIDSGVIEGIMISNPDKIKMLLNDNDVFDDFYYEFKMNFISVFENDDLLMKMQDFLHRLDLFCNMMGDKYNLEQYRTILKQSDFDFFSAVDYSPYHDREIIEEFTWGMEI